GIEVGDRVNLARLHRINGLLPTAHADKGSVARRKASLRHQIQHKEVARGVRGSHADFEALEVGKRLERSVLADSEHDAGKPTELDRRANVLSHGLRAQRMLVRAYCDINRAGEQGIERFPAAGEIGYCDG